MNLEHYLDLGWTIIGAASFNCGAVIYRLKNSEGELRHVLTYEQPL